MLHYVRFHGRGGEGVKLAGRISSRAAFLTGLTVQDSPLYGAERRGAPVVAFARFADGPIRDRGYIERPDAVVILDDSLLAHPEAGALAGIDASTLVLANTPSPAPAFREAHAISARLLVADVSSIALQVLGRNVLSAPMAGFAVKALRLAPWEVLAEAVAVELEEAGVAAAGIDRNLEAARRVFDLVPEAGFAERRPAPPAVAPSFRLPALPARFSAPAIEAEANTARRGMEGWRVYRPVVRREKCTRCFLCFALCPEGAVHLDEESYPMVDYHLCKGCLVCATECPSDAIGQVREPA
jgi:pyruvate ferredoxin oxidoreductase gamma subunit